MLLFLWHSTAYSDDVSPSVLKIERFSAERGDAQSQYFMGEHYELGDSGLSRDLDMALSWYFKAADKGYAAAQYKIGFFHEKGYAGLPGGMKAAMPWYKKAAAGGYEAAKLKIKASDGVTVSKQSKASQQKQERVRMLQANKPAMAGLPLKVPKQHVDDAQPEKTIKKLMNAKWSHDGQPAEYLPAEDMSCLKTAESEVTCFSRVRDRIVGNDRIQFTVKAVIAGFGKNGGFKTRYFYNVEEVADVPEPGPDSDRYGLRSEKGWQQPGHEAVCHMKRANSIVCSGREEDTIRFDSK